MRTALRLSAPVAGAIGVLGVLLAVKELPTERAVAIFVVLLTAIVLRDLIRHFPGREEGRPRFEAELRGRRAPRDEPSVFAGMERELMLAAAFADYAHNRLLPLLRTAAAARISLRHGVVLERDPDGARRVLGDRSWELLRPDRPQPADSLGPGLRREEIAAIIAQLESL